MINIKRLFSSFLCRIIFFVFLFSINHYDRLFACVMVPSVWKTINSVTDDKQNPTSYAITEAFMQLNYKFDMEMRASRIPVKPFVIRSIIDGKDNSKVSKEIYDIVKESFDLVFIDSEVIPYENLNEIDKETIDYNNKFKVDLIISNPRVTNIEMIDLNPQVWALLQFVLRDEVKVFVRITYGKDDEPIFLDEFEVSPTIIIQPLLSPIGGYIVKVEKNNYKSMVIDWGTVTESGNEHVMRVNLQYYAPMKTPPLDSFNSDLRKEIIKDKRYEGVCDQLVFAIKNNDLDLFNVFFDTYSDFDVNIKNSEGKSPLHYATSAGLIEMVKILIDKKANVNQKTYEEDTPLHIIAKTEKANPEIIKILIQNGADINSKNSEGFTPKDLIKKYNPNLMDVLSIK